MPAHYKNRYLNTFINKFRKRFKDDNLSLSDLHYLLNKFGINKNNCIIREYLSSLLIVQS